MSYRIRAMRPEDKDAVLKMMRIFYASEAVFSNGSEEIFRADIEQCTKENPYLEGYVFEDSGSSAKELQGYAMVAKSFSTEFGKPCIWIEDIYINEESRGLGIGSAFIQYIKDRYPDCIYRLEVEEENVGAVRLYKKCGFDFLPYKEMKR